MIGYVHSIQSLGTLDGPGVRFVVFLSGCNLRCSCCHNPDTWECGKGEKYSAEDIIARALRFREYFGKEGGITLTGGEPLLQAEFAKEVFTLAKAHGLNTCLDTSGSILNDGVRELLAVTDRVLLDIKYTTDEDYRKYVGCGIKTPLAFLEYLSQKGISTTVRQVIIPTVNDTEENILALKKITRGASSVDKVELLPFKKICTTKYDSLGIPFPFRDMKTPTREEMRALEELFDS